MLRQRLEYLDSARGIAALIVIFSHFKRGYLLPDSLTFLDRTPFHAFWFGEGAVVFFFVLSGYVISLKFFSDRENINKLEYSSYIISRIFRIFPAFWAVLALSIIAKKYFFPEHLATIPEASRWINHLWGEQSSYLKQAALVINVNENPALHLIPQAWTLQIEMLISALIPFLVIICLINPLWLFAFAFVVIGFLGFEPHLIGFTIGIAIARYSNELRQLWLNIPFKVKIGVLISAAFIYCASFMFNLNVYTTAKLTAYLGTSLLLIILIGSQQIQSVLSNKILVFLGSISYSVYLSHMVILMCVVPYTLKFLNAHYAFSNPYLTRFVGLSVLLGLTIPISYLLHIAVEKPAISFSKQLSLKVGNTLKSKNIKF
ncbi:acyltransferase family protein [Desertivirga arenae]|uniref:acyltransferase family protein n=1 Tax=Desertivirga arenae TaxID=2810309 RepID=UPI001A972E76|nr:acyltransferase [Pedobacter sp. SYSU D00823]